MKRKIIIFVMCLSLGYSEDYSQEDRILDMQKMAHAMRDIQSGFFYNNLDIVTAGAKNLKSTIAKIGPINSEKNTKDIYEKWMNNHTQMTGRTQRRIVKYADSVVEHFKAGDAQYALNIYNRISSECMKCHTSLRKW